MVDSTGTAKGAGEMNAREQALEQLKECVHYDVNFETRRVNIWLEGAGEVLKVYAESRLAEAQGRWVSVERLSECEICKTCGRPFEQVWHADDALWQQVRGETQANVCMSCFDSEARGKGVYLWWAPAPLINLSREPTQRDIQRGQELARQLGKTTAPRGELK